MHVGRELAAGNRDLTLKGLLEEEELTKKKKVGRDQKRGAYQEAGGTVSGRRELSAASELIGRASRVGTGAGHHVSRVGSHDECSFSRVERG